MVGADRQQVADDNVGEARSRHADLGGVTKPVDLPQPSAHPVPTGENLAHHRLARDTSEGSSPSRLIELHAFICRCATDVQVGAISLLGR